MALSAYRVPMKMLSLQEITKGQDWVGLGIAGNQAGHLGQAGEANDFAHLSVPDNVPKGIFPWYVPGADSFLGEFPLSEDLIQLKGSEKVQPEPEIGLILNFNYAEGEEQLLDGLTVEGFTVFNDCSRRIDQPKLSLKKNWGAHSKGMLDSIVLSSDFNQEGGEIDQFRLVCFLERGGELIQYGSDTAVSDYCYFNGQLTEWMTSQINTQEDAGPLEKLSEMLITSKPSYAVIGIGATCYTDFGNSAEKFMREGDKIIMVSYDGTKLSLDDVEKSIINGESSKPDGSLLMLKQTVTQ